MHFKVAESKEPNCPFRILDPATGSSISGVTEFNDDEGWLRVLCRDPAWSTPDKPYWAVCDKGVDLVTQIKRVPFQVVPYYDGIDDLPVVYIDDIEFENGNPVGDWLPAAQPYHSQDEV